MINQDPTVTRRAFLKLLGTASALPLLPQTAAGETQPAGDSSKDPELHRILCANILLASPVHDGTPFGWDERKEFCLEVMRAQNPDIICTQEVLGRQVPDMKKAFENFSTFGFVGPEMDARPTGYQGITKNVILFSNDRYEMQSAGGYWLSETPLIAGSVSWDALRARHVNWVRLKDRKTGREFRVIDTHFDHKGKQARVEQAKIITKEAAQYAEDFPQILAGDFNADIKNPAITTIKEAGWTDTYAAVHGPEDPGFTAHKMEGPKRETKTGKIDFIFVKGPIEPVEAKIIRDSRDGQFPSDHYFVTAAVKF